MNVELTLDETPRVPLATAGGDRPQTGPPCPFTASEMPRTVLFTVDTDEWVALSVVQRCELHRVATIGLGLGAGLLGTASLAREAFSLAVQAAFRSTPLRTIITHRRLGQSNALSSTLLNELGFRHCATNRVDDIDVFALELSSGWLGTASLEALVPIEPANQ